MHSVAVHLVGVRWGVFALGAALGDGRYRVVAVGDGGCAAVRAGWLGRENFTFLMFSNIFARVGGVGDGLGELDYGRLNAPAEG